MTNTQLIQAWIDRYYCKGKDTGKNSSRSMHYKDGILYSYAIPIARFNPGQVAMKGPTKMTNKHIELVRRMLFLNLVSYEVVEEVSTYVDFSNEPWKDPKRIPKEREGI
jgi:hypothetical protein